MTQSCDPFHAGQPQRHDAEYEQACDASDTAGRPVSAPAERDSSSLEVARRPMHLHLTVASAKGVAFLTVVDISSPLLDAPPADLRYRRKIRLQSTLTELFRSRELVWTLAERDYRVRYKQAVLGVSWAVLTPMALMVVFSVFFQHVAHVNHAGAPSPLFAYLGLVPWTFFANTLSIGGLSLVTN